MTEFHYRKLLPVSEGKRTYRYVSTAVNSHKLRGRLAIHRDANFYSSDGKLRAWIRKGHLYAGEDYAWNGSSPKRYIGTDRVGFWLGTPDFAKSRRGSFFHDILFQFAEVGKWDMFDCNYQFLCIMEDDGFELANQYFEAVEMFGQKFYGRDKQGVRMTLL